MALSVLLVGCVAPIQYDSIAIDNIEYYEAPKDEIWMKLMRYLTTNRIQIKTIDKESGIIYAENLHIDPSQWGQNCKSGLLETENGGVATLNVFVAEFEPGVTSVTVNAFILRRIGSALTTRACPSNGKLEDMIFGALGGRTDARPSSLSGSNY